MSKSLPLATVLAIAGVLVMPDASVAQAPSGDSVVGSGTIDLGSAVGIEVDARSGPSGENPTGHVTMTFVGTRLDGNVTCLIVRDDDSAVLNFVSTTGFLQRMTITDGSASGSNDVIGLSFPQPPATDCNTGTQTFIGFFTLIGDIVVTDAPPLPTSKDQCKNGGWQSYGIFKNQGDCVSFVATGGKNPPAKQIG
jgi:hypothetical protein